MREICEARWPVQGLIGQVSSLENQVTRVDNHISRLESQNQHVGQQIADVYTLLIELREEIWKILENTNREQVS